MDSYSDLFEKISEQESSEDVLILRIAQELEQLTGALERDYWFHEDIKYSESDVHDWLKENRPEFYERAFVEPETVEGSDVIIDALKALGLMKDWVDVEEKDLQTPEDEERWRSATSAPEE